MVIMREREFSRIKEVIADKKKWVRETEKSIPEKMDTIKAISLELEEMQSKMSEKETALKAVKEELHELETERKSRLGTIESLETQLKVMLAAEPSEEEKKEKKAKAARLATPLDFFMKKQEGLCHGNS